MSVQMTASAALAGVKLKAEPSRIAKISKAITGYTLFVFILFTD